eukprot:TRINITY_DN4980_c1_g1_i1.p1 TRINITY_DN4980_c1_g1~~TRINITY_DN4980_c1_g1_i1.p1  ORF type:complete len:1036 (+),score=300.83 TRINITY_DN4980_c1_g1_i1:143-3109(+)
MTDELLADLCRHTYFDMDELQRIKSHFLKVTEGSEVLKQETFRRLYPELDELASPSILEQSVPDDDDEVSEPFDPINGSQDSCKSSHENTGRGRTSSSDKDGQVASLDGARSTYESLSSYILEAGKISLAKSLFQAFDKNGDGFITFYEYVKALSMMCRGTPSERVSIAFEVLDVDGDGTLELKEALLVAQTLEHTISKQQGTVDSSATEVLGNLFVVAVEQGKDGRLHLRPRDTTDGNRGSKWTSGTRTKHVRRINREQFIDRAKEDPDIRRLFGFFHYLENTALQPVINEMNQLQLRRSWTNMMHQLQSTSGLVTKHATSVLGGMRRRWLTVSSGFMWYSKKENGPIRVILPLQHASAFTESDESMDFEIVFDECRYKFTVDDLAKKVEWLAAVRNNVGDCGSADRKETRYDSFAGVRRGIGAEFFVLGADYYPALYRELVEAQKRIFIAGWWLVPHLPLIREPGKGHITLMEVLLEAANRGVEIYVLTWQETEIAGLGLDSRHYAHEMQQAHKNIHALTHPHTTPLVWSHHQKFVVVDEDIAFVGGIDLCYMRYETKDYPLTDQHAEYKDQLFPGRDYGNLCITAGRKGDPRGDQVDRNTVPRMPWHDVHMSVNGPAALDVAYNFIQRWNHAVVTTGAASSLLLSPCPRTPGGHRGSCKVQVTRSIAMWSGGVPVENSIYKAYIDAINHAKHYIYIENQYFISSTFSDRPKNRIALALYERIKLAIERRENFRVFVMIPLFPAGNLVDIATRYVVKWIYKTINRRKTSIFHLLGKDFPDVDLENYIQFFSLRAWDKLGDAYVTEQVYIHSKLMIVDDETAILGSANINDRSMKGSRDSEIAVVLEDKNKVAGHMNGEEVQVSEKVKQLRLKLWRYHLGLKDSEPDDIIDDPVSDATYHGLWLHIAHNNSSLYEEIFTGLVESAKNLEDYSTVPSLSTTLKTERVADRSAMIKGNLILFPFGALEDEENTPTMTDAEWFINKDTFL